MSDCTCSRCTPEAQEAHEGLRARIAALEAENARLDAAWVERTALVMGQRDTLRFHLRAIALALGLRADAEPDAVLTFARRLKITPDWECGHGAKLAEACEDCFIAGLDAANEGAKR